MEKITIPLSVKRNINTLEYPMWSPSRILAKNTAYENKNYILKSSGMMLPTSFDMDVLMNLLSLSQTEKNCLLSFTSYAFISRILKLSHSMTTYTMVENSIKKWFLSYIRYNSLYGDGKYSKTSDIHIFEHITYPEKMEGNKFKKVEIQFTKAFYYLNLEKYSLNIDIDFYTSIKNPYGKRLYELLIKSFQNGNEFKISLPKIIEKLPMPQGYVLSKKRECIEKGLESVNKSLSNRQATYRYFVEFNIREHGFDKEIVCNFVQLDI